MSSCFAVNVGGVGVVSGGVVVVSKKAMVADFDGFGGLNGLGHVTVNHVADGGVDNTVGVAVSAALR